MDTLRTRAPSRRKLRGRLTKREPFFAISIHPVGPPPVEQPEERQSQIFSWPIRKVLGRYDELNPSIRVRPTSVAVPSPTPARSRMQACPLGCGGVDRVAWGLGCGPGRRVRCGVGNFGRWDFLGGLCGGQLLRTHLGGDQLPPQAPEIFDLGPITSTASSEPPRATPQTPGHELDPSSPQRKNRNPALSSKR